MRTTTLATTLIILLCAAPLAAQTDAPQPTQKTPTSTAWIAQLDIDQIDPRHKENLAKITLLLRSGDVPRAKRLEYARRYLRGEYKFHTQDPEQLLDHESEYWYVLNQAVRTLGRLNDTASISFLEEKLALWEAEMRKPQPQRTLVAPSSSLTKAVIARLKAVRDIPEVASAADLVRRFERMLQHAGFSSDIGAWHRELDAAIKEADKYVHGRAGLYEDLILQYGQMLLEAGWKGVDITPASAIIRLDYEVGRGLLIRETYEAYVQLAKVPPDKAAQHIVDEAVHWQVYSSNELPKAQVLADMGVSVLPLVWKKLEWAAQHRDQLKGSGIGLVALMRVLATVGGEQALPLVEPFLNHENPWVRDYACQVKEHVQQGKVFSFAPYF
ncbi:MAG: hypothetical protein N2651_01335 [Fimbriimonadales bacterium]|nr:hypothetical protein [Fimbriimonadales bacterium]